ncbi:MAG: 2-oxo acid dehydrogenase subunit E2 [Nitrososphaerota archaeon]|nr:2-oxo acid dehydrogenase subunit E2 [Nitrososphaerota archaeon]
MKEILMPRFDPEMKSGKVVEWLKKEGDKIAKGEPIVRIDTEKVSIDIESPAEGTLAKIIVNPPAEVPVGIALGTIAEEGEAVEGKQPTGPAISKVEAPIIQASKPQPAVPEEKTSQRENWVRASPSARRAARELGVDLKQVGGTGPLGRVTSKDVQKFAETPQARSVPAQPEAVTTEAKPVKVVPLTSMRSTIAERMTQSWTQIPQVPLFVDVKLVEAEKFRAALEKLIGKRVSFTAIVTKAVASALRAFPDINCRFENGEMHLFEDVDVSIAVALDSGLITPVVRNANKKTASEISAEIEDLATRARSGRLTPSEVRGGTTSVSSLGGFGVDMFIPIINPPQVSIIGAGQVRKDGHDNPYMTLTLVFDHRVTDGARAAQLLQKIKDYIESPYLLQMG